MTSSLFLLCSCLFAASVHAAAGASEEERIWANKYVLENHLKHASKMGGDRDGYLATVHRVYCSAPEFSDGAWQESWTEPDKKGNQHRNWIWNTQTGGGKKMTLTVDDNGRVRSLHMGHGKPRPKKDGTSETMVGGFKDLQKQPCSNCSGNCLDKISDDDLKLVPTSEEAEKMDVTSPRSGDELSEESTVKVAASEPMGVQRKYLLFGTALSFTFAAGFALGKKWDRKGADIYSLLEESQASEL